jgi:EamA domain-containing membrane protein RarD
MLIVAVSQVFFGDSLTTQQMIAYAIATTGFVLFNVQQAKKRDLRLCVGNERPKQQ